MRFTRFGASLATVAWSGRLAVRGVVVSTPNVRMLSASTRSAPKKRSQRRLHYAV